MSEDEKKEKDEFLLSNAFNVHKMKLLKHFAVKT